MAVDAFGHSDTGRERRQNEDNYLCLQLAPDADVYLLVVADGMGGHVGGAMASELAVNCLRRIATELLHSTDFDGSPGDILRRGFGDANRKIMAEASREAALKGMGTTMVAALLLGDRATVANVGDSRCYHLLADEMRRVTQDHSWRQEQLSLGALSTDEIEASPFRGMITRALGLEADLEVDLSELVVAAGEYLVLCTDGAHGQLSDEEVERLVRESADAEAACRAVIECSNEAGGIDNVTCVIARRMEDAAAEIASTTLKLRVGELGAVGSDE